MSKLLKDFKDFALKGNVVDMAVGVVIGGAFGKIVTSMVDDIIMPLVSRVTGGVNFTDLKWVITPGQAATETTAEIAEVALRYGNFIQTTVDFLIIAFCIFIAIKGITKLKKQEKEAPAAPEAPAEEILLLREIRDSLKK